MYVKKLPPLTFFNCGTNSCWNFKKYVQKWRKRLCRNIKRLRKNISFYFKSTYDFHHKNFITLS